MSTRSLILSAAVNSVKAPTGFWYTKASGNSSYPGCLAVDTLGNIYCTSFNGTSTAILYKFDSTGALIFAISISNFYCNGIQTDASNNVYIGGTDYVNNNIAIIKLTSSGVLVFKKTFGHSLMGILGNGIALDSSANIYISSEFQVTGYTTGARDGLVIKLNSAGTYLSRLHYNGVGSTWERPTGLISDASGNLLVPGYISSGAGGLLKLNSSLTILSSLKHTAGGAGMAAEWSTSGSFVFASNSNTLTKMNSSNVMTWSKSYTVYNERIEEIVLDASGNAYVLMNAVSDSAGYLLFKLDVNGTLVWMVRFTLNNGQVFSPSNYYAYNKKMDCTSDSLIFVLPIDGCVTLFKIPLTGIVPGTYGIFNVTNVIAAYTPVNYTGGFVTASAVATNTLPVTAQTCNLGNPVTLSSETIVTTII